MMASSLLWRVSLITGGWKRGRFVGISGRENTWVGWFRNLGGVRCCLLMVGMYRPVGTNLENWLHFKCLVSAG